MSVSASSSIINLQDFEEAAVKKIPADRLAYIRGGAGDGISLAADRKIYDNVYLLPRFMFFDLFCLGVKGLFCLGMKGLSL